MTFIRLLVALAVAVVAAVGLILIGLEPVFALGGGILVGVLALLTRLRTASTFVDEGPQGAETSRRGSEISRLAWGFNPRTGAASEIIARRARAILRRRLARRSVDVDDPAQRAQVDALIGAGLWDRISARQVRADDVRQALDAADQLVAASVTPTSRPTIDRSAHDRHD